MRTAPAFRPLLLLATLLVTAFAVRAAWASTTINSYLYQVEGAGPIGFWNLDEASGAVLNWETGNTAVVVGSPTYGQTTLLTGDPGTSMGLSGTAGFQITTDSAIYQRERVQPWTFECLSNPSITRSGASTAGYLFTTEQLSGSFSGNSIAELWDGTSKTVLQVFLINTAGSAWIWIKGSQDIPNAQTNHIAVIYSGGSTAAAFTLMVNGVVDHSVTVVADSLTGSVLNSVVPEIGLGPDGSTGGLKAAGLQAVAQYPTALSVATLQAHNAAIASPATVSAQVPGVGGVGTDEAGKVVTIKFNLTPNAVLVPAFGAAGFSATVNGVGATIDSVQAVQNQVKITLHTAVSPGDTVLVAYSGGNLTDNCLPRNVVGNFSVAAVNNCLGLNPTASTTLQRASAGLIYQASFNGADAATWTNASGKWSFPNSPSFTVFGALPPSLVGPTTYGQADYQGARNAQLVIDADGTYRLFYTAFSDGAGAGVATFVNCWQFLANSTDQGLTWTRAGALDPLNYTDNTHTTRRTLATEGWNERRVIGGTPTWIYWRLFATGAGGIQPYISDVWTATAGPLGPYTQQGVFSPPAMSYASRNFFAGSVYLNGSTYEIFVTGNAGETANSTGRATATSLAGPYTLVTPADIPTGLTADGYVRENVKVVKHVGMGIFVMTNNIFGTITNSPLVTELRTSSALDTWTGSGVVVSRPQRGCLLDSPAAPIVSGILSPALRSDASLYEDASGYVPAIYDNDSWPALAGDVYQDYGRNVRGCVMEPSAYCAQITDATATVYATTHAVTNANVNHEFVLTEPYGTVGTVEYWFRADSGLANGYKVVFTGGQVAKLYKVVSSSATLLGGSGTQLVAVGGADNRVRIEAQGTSLNVWLDGELQASVTDSTYSTGTTIGFTAANALNSTIRTLSLRKSDTITVTGAGSGQVVVLRAAGGLPVQSQIATSGSVTFTVTHSPYHRIDIGGLQYTAADGGLIWGGDSVGLAGGAGGLGIPNIPNIPSIPSIAFRIPRP